MPKTKSKPVKPKSAASKTSPKVAPKAASKTMDAKKIDKKAPIKPTPKATPKLNPKVSSKSSSKVDSKIDAKTKVIAKLAEPVKKAAKKEKPVKKVAKTERPEIELEDDFEAEDFDGSEIAEYEDDLKAVESEDEDSDDVDLLDEEEIPKTSEEVYLTDAEGNRYCRARDCDQTAAVDVYCRYHYLLFWKRIQIRKEILIGGKLERYVEELTGRYPDKFLEMILRDLRTEKDFLGAIQELEIDEAGLDNEFEEDSQTYIDEVRGIGESASVDDEEF